MPALCGLEAFLVDEPDEEVQGVANAIEGDNENIKLTKRVKLLQFATKKEKWLITAAAIGNVYNGAAYSLILTLLILCAQAKINGQNWKGYIVGMAIAVAVDFAAGFVAAALAELAAERQLRKLKLAFLDHLMNQEMGYFDKFDAVSLAVRLNYQADVIRRSTGQKYAQIWLYGGLIFACLIRMFNADAKLAGLSLVLLPLIIITGWWAAFVDNRADRISQNAFASAASIAREALQNVKTVKSFALEGMMTQRFRAAANKAERSTTRAGVLAGLALGLHNGMIFCTFGFALWYGVKVIADAKESNTTKEFNDVDLVSVFGCILMIAFGMSKIFPTLITISKAKYAIRQVLQVYARESKINPSEEGGSIMKLKGDIRFNNVAFKYNPDADRNVFQSLNLHIPAGKSVALVGASGSGKSTIIQLIERFYDVTGGQLTVDDVPIESINLLNLRSQIALVSQEPRLFSDTIAANIGCGREGSTRDEIIDAAKKANAHDFIMQFPDGYDTWVGESGGQLSGGQKQRIAIARALIRDPQILILDEATSALDNESEKIVQETINEVVKDSQRTTIIIAHRLTTVRNADKIVVLDNPKGDGAIVVEEGTHDELLRIENGLYAALVASQLGKEAADGASPADAVDWSIRMSSQLATSFSRDLAPSRQSSLLRLHSKFAQSKDTIASKNEIEGGWRLLTSAIPEEQKEARVKPRVYRRTARIIRDQWPSTLIGIIATCVSGFAWPAIGFALARSIACFFYADYNEQRREAKKYLLFYIILGIVSLFSIALSRAFGDRVAAILVKRLRTSVFDTFLKKTASFFDDPNHSSGMLVSILSLDLTRLGNWGGANLAAYFTTIAVFLAAAAVSLNAYWQLGLVTLGGSCLLAPTSWINSQLVSTGRLEFGRHQVGRKRQVEVIDGVAMSRSDAIMTEAILNIRAITAYNLQESMSTRYKEAVNRDYAIGKRGAWFTGLSWGTSQCLILGIVVACIYYAFWLLEREIGDPWNMVQAILVLLFAAFNIGRAFSALSEDSKARESAAKVYALTDQPKPFDEYSEKGTYLDHIDDIQFNRVAFRYIRRPDLPIYRDVTFRIPKGQVTALVGGSGCGKSTAIQLIQHLYMIGEGFEYSDEMGDITVNGIKMSELNIQALRSCIGIVSQEPALFWGTIEDNISYGCPGCTAEDIKAAAMAANAWDFIQKLPDGMQTDVGRGGAKLSGGQKQRIAIARALVRKPKLLILDEATSALDAESERVVQETLDRLLATRQFTTVMIAHRLSTVRKADQIVVFLNADQRGSKVAEIGTHEELMKIKNGAYRGLVRIAENK